MATFMAGSAALAGVIAAGVLCVAPARAACSPVSPTCEYAFGGTSSDTADLVLTLSNGTSLTIAATIQGSITSFGVPNFGVPSTSYLAGVYGGASWRDFFEFNLPSESDDVTVTSANLTLTTGVVNSALAYTLLGPTAVISSLTASTPNPTLYAALGTGTAYTTNPYLLSPNSLSQIIIALNEAAVNNLNNEIHGGNQQFLIAGKVAPIPEPSTWIMMLAGFAGLGFLARRRAARRRAAAAAG
jgi:PEP-CTERM motif